VKRRRRPALVRSRLVFSRDGKLAEYWPIDWLPRALVLSLKGMDAHARRDVLSILLGLPGPWWPDRVQPISLPVTLHVTRRLRAREPDERALVQSLQRRDRRLVAFMNQVPSLGFTKEEQDTMLAIIARARHRVRLLHGPHTPRVTQRSPRVQGAPDRSALRWLGPQAAALVNYFREQGKCSEPAACRQAAHVLSLASEQRITSAMVKDRALRTRGHK
jgi:hypothetical protein